MDRHPSRRALLGAAAAAGACAFGRKLLPAHAADAVPKRLVILYSHHGMVYTSWKPRGAGGVGEPTETAFELGPMHEPLKPFKQDLVLVSGIDMRSWANGRQGNGHEAGQCHSLTNTAQASSSQAGGPSIDQFIANKLKEKNGGQPVTSLGSLVVQVTNGGGGLQNMMTWSGPRALVPAEKSARRALERVFPGGKPPGGGAGVDLTPVFARRRRALGLASGEMKALGAKLGKDDRERLDAHAAFVADLQKRLSAPGAAARTCEAPASVTEGGWQASMDGMQRVAHAALACDVTRVVTILADTPPGDLYGYSGGMFGTPNVHELAHRVDNGVGKDAGMTGKMTDYCLVYARQLAKLLDLLKKTPEADGKTLLDHTMVLWCGELASGNHGCANLKWVLAGGSSVIKTGRYLNFGSYDRGGYGPDGKVPGHGNLFVSIAQAMGLDVQSFGVSNGPLPGLAPSV